MSESLSVSLLNAKKLLLNPKLKECEDISTEVYLSLRKFKTTNSIHELIHAQNVLSQIKNSVIGSPIQLINIMNDEISDTIQDFDDTVQCEPISMSLSGSLLSQSLQNSIIHEKVESISNIFDSIETDDVSYLNIKPKQIEFSTPKMSIISQKSCQLQLTPESNHESIEQNNENIVSIIFSVIVCCFGIIMVSK
ncbi:hypothetical protein SS50377_23965 [Spironucleus salmonicida]|uniref:Uncharacterized protein n=1 Tax=Spironucleus salmonicida TaxID=348837 RepID=V6LQ93_9EUKA|nr:hypothetical protein SS50377_23965 [Spironucleus salmonicida]|eukprot:EST42929.1 Hypothetical protein SS50377_17461 [Spironucleus salmonicida]